MALVEAVSGQTGQQPSCEVRIPAGDRMVNADLVVPPGAGGLVVFVHGDGTGRLSQRNNFLAAELWQAGFGTLLIDPLVNEKDTPREALFDVSLLSKRLVEVILWTRKEDATRSLPVACLAAGIGAAAALVASCDTACALQAIVSRGGRPDLAQRVLGDVRIPTLLIVGGEDGETLCANQESLYRLRCLRRLAVIPNASQLFLEPGTLAEVARLSSSWFGQWLVPG